jgi:hypothetical protein
MATEGNAERLEEWMRGFEGGMERAVEAAAEETVKES